MLSDGINSICVIFGGVMSRQGRLWSVRKDAKMGVSYQSFELP